MKARGEFWLELVKNFEKPNNMMEPATRPSPMPPISCRPKTLPVTQIENLIRDPYTQHQKSFHKGFKKEDLKKIVK